MAGNFSYVIPGRLAGCAQPGRFSDLRSDLAGLSRMGIGAVVSLTEQPLDGAALSDFGFRALHLPVPDFTAPTRGQMREFVEFVDLCLGEGVAVVVHCGAGVGRTGTMLACYLVSRGESPAQAIGRVREARPGSIETPEQERSIAEYHKSVASRAKKSKKRD